MNIAVDGYGLDSTRPNVPTNGYGLGVVVVGRLIDRYTFGPIPLDTLTARRRSTPRRFAPMTRRR